MSTESSRTMFLNIVGLCIITLIPCSVKSEVASCNVFPCDDGSFIPTTRVCDKVLDCPDGSDEHEECPDVTDDCSLQCFDKSCISSLFVCDEVDDCAQNEDEHCFNTQPTPTEIDDDCSEKEIMLNVNEKYTLTSPDYPNQYNAVANCSWYVEARDRSHRIISIKISFIDINLEECLDFVTIGEGENVRNWTSVLFRATGNSTFDDVTIDNSYIWITFDSSTAVSGRGFHIELEAIRSDFCYEGYFMCSSDSVCIREGLTCDGIADCVDASDESEEKCGSCGFEEFRCPDTSVCIYNCYVCDNYENDCPNNADEDQVLCSDKCNVDAYILPLNSIAGDGNQCLYESGSYVNFTCREGYTLVGQPEVLCNGYTFNEFPTCQEDCIELVLSDDIIIDGNFTHGSLVSFSCTAGYQLLPADATSTTCDNGIYLDALPRSCRDIDECADLPCDVLATCLNTEGSYECSCPAGYEQVENKCIDINECNQDGACAGNTTSTCVNTDGSFNCTCNEGYFGDGHTCQEIYFFPWGYDEGDINLRDVYNEDVQSSEFISPTIKPVTGFPFFGEFFYSLYFTENGVIILINENDEKFGFANPPVEGITSDSSNRIIAPFWSDVDLVDPAIGNVFYQVRESVSSDIGRVRRNTDQQDVLNEASMRVQELLGENNALPDNATFEANWMLTVTWDKVVQYPVADNQDNTATFQAILVTDGIYSFAIFNYEVGGMRWNPEVLLQKNLIIGYGVGSQGQLSNVQQDETLFPTTNSRYFPDMTSNSDSNGQWLFRLENNDQNVDLNYRRYCQDWYLQQEQDINDGLPWIGWLGTCPCVFQQGTNDMNFGNTRRFGRSSVVRVKIPSDVLKEIESVAGSPFCITTSANQYGASLTCCYREDGSLVEGYGDDVFSSSFVSKTSPKFGSYFDEDLYNLWMNEDILPRYACCSESNDPYYCDLYAQARPTGTCRGYIPPHIGWMFGDPHIKTLDGYEYTFNGLGEFILVTVDDGDFVLQGRMQTPPINGEVVQATAFTAFAAQQGGTKVQISINSDGSGLEVIVNESIEVDVTSLPEEYYTSPDDPTFTIKLPTGESTTNKVIASWGSGIAIMVGFTAPLLEVVLSAPDDLRESRTKGLYGVWNGNWNDDFTYPDNTMLMIPENRNLTERELYDFGLTWRTTPDNALFIYQNGQTWADINDLEFSPIFFDDLLASKADDPMYEQAIQSCGTNEECLFDALVTNNITVGTQTKDTSDTNNEGAENLANFPPNITGIRETSATTALVGDNRLNVIVGDLYTFEVDSFDANGDIISFSLQDALPGGSITSDGELSWRPLSSDGVMLTIIATDSRGATSALPLEVVICSCFNDGVCNFDQLVDGSDITNNKYAVAQCVCTLAWTGSDCSVDYDYCMNQPCYPSVSCFDNKAPEANATCGSCPDGLVGNGFKCYDYNECDDDVCEQICTNTLLSYSCDCFDGYEIQPDGSNCIDIDECLIDSDSCSNAAQCTNTLGSYNCMCLEGYSDLNGDGTVCNDINECSFVEYPCDENADCLNSDGSFTCTCTDGFEGTGKVCTDIDECSRAFDNCDPNADCINSPGSYSCVCSDGWTGDGLACTDVNECLSVEFLCHQRASCTNTMGNYYCSCPVGYAGDGVTCIDIDECTDGTNTCTELEDCINSQGSFTCRCKSGYLTESDGNCTDINECDVNLPCDFNAECSNTPGSFSCSCSDGYTGDGLVCNDIDECQLSTDNCDQVCSNSLGSFSCDCFDSFEIQNDGVSCLVSSDAQCEEDVCVNAFCVIGDDGDPTCTCHSGYEEYNSTLCTDINECSSDSDNMCDTICNNSNGGYVCQCEDGYLLNTDIRTCSDVNECDDVDICSSNAACINTIGAYNCSCNSGYTSTDDDCDDINECDVMSSQCIGTDTCPYQRCDERGVCTNTDGSYICQCMDGYIGDGYTCLDVNECSTSPCDTMATCTNYNGSYSCQCNDGFKGDGVNCTDIDECIDTNLCSVNSVCSNTLGSYQCICESGYRSNSALGCDNIDECLEGKNNCSIRATCLDSEGGFNCVCIKGYEGDGFICTDLNECDGTNDCDSNAMCSNSDGSYACFCNEGFFNDQGGSATTGKCMNIDECTLNIDTCSSNAICTDIDGNYTCLCKDGFAGNGYSCTDIDECSTSVPCSVNENKICVNTEGGFECICANNYVMSGDMCLEAISRSLSVNFTDIKGTRVSFNPDIMESETIRKALAYDVLNLLNTTSISNSIQDVNVDTYASILNIIQVTFRVDLALNSDITMADIEIAFSNGLVDDVLLSPDSVVASQEVVVTEPVTDPCAEGTHDCFSGNFTRCVFISDGLFSCEDCRMGFEQLADSCIDIDECISGDSVCGENEDCLNTVGSYQCSCQQNYKMFNGICIEDIEYKLVIVIFTIDLVDGTTAEYVVDLDDPTSSIYKEYEMLSCEAVDNTVADDGVFTDLRTCVAVRFESGSVVAVLEIGLQPETVYTAEDLAFAIKNGSENAGRLTVNAESVTAKDLIECTPDYCNNGGTCIYDSLDFTVTCTCLKGYSGDICQHENDIMTLLIVVIVVCIVILTIILGSLTIAAYTYWKRIHKLKMFKRGLEDSSSETSESVILAQLEERFQRNTTMTESNTNQNHSTGFVRPYLATGEI